MKNKFTFFVSLSLVLFAALGCSSLNPLGGDSASQSNKSIGDKAVDVAVGESKIGVPECDEVMDKVTAELNSPDEGYVTKAIKATVLNRIKDGIRESYEKNPNDTAELVKTCKEFAVQFAKYKAEDEAKKKEQEQK